ncbi:MAG: helix-turn-helix transcriptional regulator [Terriglobales bacterium]
MATEEALLTVKAAAVRLGLTQATIRAWLLRRRIGCVRLSPRAVRIPSSEVERLIRQGTVPRLEGR